jgi:transcriptional regulator with XRE-family HTH domain
MKTMSEIRQHNLQKIADKFESQRELADALDTTPGYINQLLSGHRAIGEKSARKFEEKLKLNTFELDDIAIIDGAVIHSETCSEPCSEHYYGNLLEFNANNITKPVERPPIVEPTKWKNLPPQLRALVEDLINQYINGQLSPDHIKSLQHLVDIFCNLRTKK